MISTDISDFVDNRKLLLSFATKETGFLPLVLYRPESTVQTVEKELHKLVIDAGLGEILGKLMGYHRFTASKAAVLDMLRGCLDSQLC